MTMTTSHHEPMNGTSDDFESALAKLPIETGDIERVDMKAVAVLNRSEVETQIDAAHKHRRSIAHFLREAMTLATMTREVAESCIYALPRGGKTIPGPSVRLAEICASAYGNLHIGARVLGVEEKEIAAQGVAWDLERNVRVSVEARRRITDSRGHRYNDDMITMTGNAAASIALRNAIFRVIPRAYVDTIYREARRVAVGDAKTLADRRAAVFANFEKLGVTRERVLARVEKGAIEDVGLEDLEVLIGLGTAIRGGDMKIDDAFPAQAPAPAAPSEDGRRISMRRSPQQTAAAPAQQPQAAPAQTPPAQQAPAATPARGRGAKKDEPKAAPADAAPTAPTCFVCQKPIEGEAIVTRGEDGRGKPRHPDCSPFGAANDGDEPHEREPGEEG